MFTNISPDGEVGSVVRGATFSFTINATLTPDETWTASSIDSVVITPSFTAIEEPNITVTDGVTSSTVDGSYSSRFNDVIQYVSACSSDKLETPTTVIGLGNVPEGKQIFDFVQDTAVQQYDIAYTVDVTFTYTPEVGDDVTDTEQHAITHANKNDWTQPGVDLKAYLDRNTFTDCT